MATVHETVPVVNFGDFIKGDSKVKSAIAAAVDEAFRNVGFVCLSNHGIEQARVDEAFSWVRCKILLMSLMYRC